MYYAWLDGRENINTGRIYSKVYAGFPTTAVAEPGLPAAFRLEQNYPNPFNPSTAIRYQLTALSRVSLRIYNVLGQQIATLVDGDRLAGYHQETWDATGYASGAYVYEFIAVDEHGNKQVSRKRMVLLK